MVTSMLRKDNPKTYENLTVYKYIGIIHNLKFF